jgi:malate synthase
VKKTIEDEIAKISDRVGTEAYAAGRWSEARTTFTDMALDEEFADFLTLPAYERMP